MTIIIAAILAHVVALIIAAKQICGRAEQPTAGRDPGRHGSICVLSQSLPNPESPSGYSQFWRARADFERRFFLTLAVAAVVGFALGILGTAMVAFR